MFRLTFAAPRDLPLAVAAVRAALAGHGVVALPTETFYGLAVSPDDAAAVDRLLALKGRAAEKALPVAAASLDEVEALGVLAEPWRSRLRAAWPAPLSVVLPARRRLAACGETVAVRVPDHELLRRLLARVGPLTVTSANRAGEPPAATPEEVTQALGTGLAVLLDGGPCPGGRPSTLLDLSSAVPTVLRDGAWAVPRDWLEGRPKSGQMRS
jgi:L-threonylcarbamoyladenylate synthase